MHRLITILLLFIPLLCGCGRRRTIQVKDARKRAELTLTTAPNQKPSVHSLSVRIHGQVEGVAFISGSIVYTQRVSGRFDIKANHEYYNTNCTVLYSPESVQSGKFSVDYESGTIE